MSWAPTHKYLYPECERAQFFSPLLFFKRIKEAEDTFGSREKDYQAQLEEYKQFEQKAKNKMREMENLLEQATFDRENYKAQLSGNDGRISALESQIARMEAMKNDCEFKLSSLYSILRRLLGLRSQSQPPTPDESSPKKNRRSYRGRTRSNSGETTLKNTTRGYIGPRSGFSKTSLHLCRRYSKPKRLCFLEEVFTCFSLALIVSKMRKKIFTKNSNSVMYYCRINLGYLT